MAPFWSLEPTLEPRCHQSPKLCINLVPQGTQKRPLWIPLGTLRPNKSSKFLKKYLKCMDLKTQHEKVVIQDPPRPQKVWFYYSKTHVFEDAPYPEKVTKMRPKWAPKDPQRHPMAPKGPIQGLSKSEQKINT